MKQIRVADIMVPIPNCLTVRKDDSLLDVFQALDQTRKSKIESPHKDSIVFDENGAFLGKVTMIDIFRALEPNYRKVEQQHKMASMLSAGAVMKIARDFNLWFEPTQTIRQRAGQLKVAAKLSDQGKILMPLDNYGFSRLFTWISDKFGVSWQLNLP